MSSLRQLATYVDQLSPEHLRQGELGLAVFGPGTGEATLIKSPDGRYSVVDGCRSPGRRRPDGRGDPVREFLNQIPGLERNGSDSLECVLWTHPHADHYRGLGELVDAYQGRIERCVMLRDICGSVGEALQTIFRQRLDSDAYRHLNYAINQFMSLHTDLLSSPGRFHVFGEYNELWARTSGSSTYRWVSCGPADSDFTGIIRRMYEHDDGVLRFDINHDPNRMSGALFIEWGAAHTLLAGDLVAQRGNFHGWAAVRERLPTPMQVIKVAHHASEEAHDSELWDRLHPQLAIVTPFLNASRKQPPRPADIRRLLDSGAEVVLTNFPAWLSDNTPGDPRPSQRDPGGGGSYHSAVAVSLDATGQITSLTLAGAADLYHI